MVGHVRHDHARALRHAANSKCAAGIFGIGSFERNSSLFRNGVSGHNGASSTIPRGFADDSVQRRNAGFEGSNIKLLTDDTRRGNQHVFGHAADREATMPAVLRAFSSQLTQLQRWRCQS